MSRRPNDPNAGDVGRIFLNLLGIKTPKEISYKSGIGVVFELKAKEESSSYSSYRISMYSNRAPHTRISSYNFII